MEKNLFCEKSILIHATAGEIITCQKEKVLQFSYWSSQEGYEDVPENYSVITYSIQSIRDNNCELTYRRDKIPLEFERANQEKYLPMLMEGIKKLSENE